MIAQEARTGHGAHVRLGEPRGARADAGDRRRALLEPVAAGARGARARARATRWRCARCASTATATSCSTWSTPTGRRATPARPPASTAQVGDGTRRAGRGRRAARSARAGHVARVAEVIARRRRERPEKSYVVSLLDAGLPKINGKITEEARRADRGAARGRRRAHRARGRRPASSTCWSAWRRRACRSTRCSRELRRRFGVSGIDEKASRKK